MTASRIRNDHGFSYYHLYNRIAGLPGEFPFGGREKKKMLGLLKELSRFYVVEVVNFCIMSNHWHIVVAVPARDQLPHKINPSCFTGKWND